MNISPFLSCQDYRSYDKLQARNCRVQPLIGDWEDGRCWGDWKWTRSQAISLRQETIHAAVVECVIWVHHDTHSNKGVESEHRWHQQRWNLWFRQAAAGKVNLRVLDSLVDPAHVSYYLQRRCHSSTEINHENVRDKQDKYKQKKVHWYLMERQEYMTGDDTIGTVQALPKAVFTSDYALILPAMNTRRKLT